MIHVVIGLLKNTKGEFLIAERPSHKPWSGLWEFPGGKVENNETAFAALQREWREEVGIQIINADPWFQHAYEYPERKILLDIWWITQFEGEPFGAESQVIRWVSPKDLSQYKFPQANNIIIEKLCA